MALFFLYNKCNDGHEPDRVNILYLEIGFYLSVFLSSRTWGKDIQNTLKCDENNKTCMQEENR
jgi:hypothetical protein